MTFWQSILLGIIQGLTEFLPMSSSAHLVLTPYLLGWDISDQAAFIFDVLVQMGTLIAVIIYFFKDLLDIFKAFLAGIWNKKPFAEPAARLGWYLVIASIPAVIAGVLLKDIVEQAFASPVATALFLLVTAAMLLAAEKIGRKARHLEQLTWLDALIVGLFQALSLFPGISRSGSTISGGMFRGLDRPAAARFSFLMSVPVMLGAGGIAILDLLDVPNFASQIPTLSVGFLASLVVGYLSIRWLLGYLVKRPLYLFSGYCVLISVLVLVVALFRGGG